MNKGIFHHVKQIVYDKKSLNDLCRTFHFVVIKDACQIIEDNSSYI
jgi:hypothetical protein